MAKISVLIVLLPYLCTILCNKTSNNNDNECGISDHSPLEHSSPMRVSPGDWPWLVAVFTNESGRNTFELCCAGTLLTNRHILTAAHCVKLNPYSNTTIHANQITVVLGRFNMNQWHESGVINRKVEKIEIHPDYAHASCADSDLAILTLKTPVEFNNFVRPICLWSGSTDLQDVVDKTGYVAGWGMRSVLLALPEEPRVTKVPIVSQETCLGTDMAFFELTSKRTFCAGWRNHSSCVEDSGSGLVLLDNTTNRYQLRGVVSRTLFHSDSCDLRSYVVYVDAAKYIPWIQQHISTV